MVFGHPCRFGGISCDAQPLKQYLCFHVSLNPYWNNWPVSLVLDLIV
jgi:hypothetical protein